MAMNRGESPQAIHTKGRYARCTAWTSGEMDLPADSDEEEKCDEIQNEKTRGAFKD
jgi:hypothetical protein